MQEDKIYQISYKYDKKNRSEEVFSASAEQAKNRLERFKQEHKNYTEIKLIEIPFLDVFLDPQ